MHNEHPFITATSWVWGVHRCVYVFVPKDKLNDCTISFFFFFPFPSAYAVSY